jgi:hypothetical protein
MKILVTGGRKYIDADKLFYILDEIHGETPITLLINGDAKGADQMSTVWASANNVPTEVYTANWAKFGRSAGIRRNIDMIMAHPDTDLVVAFPGGDGTSDMIHRALVAGVKVKRID